MKLKLLFLSFFFLSCASLQVMISPKYIEVYNAQDMQALFAEPLYDTHVNIRGGTYLLQTQEFIDSSCATCPDDNNIVNTNFGIRVQGERIRISSDANDKPIIVTGASYGIYFDDCLDCSLSHVNITGGRISNDNRSTNAGIVIRNSSVDIDYCNIYQNRGEQARIVDFNKGIGGIAVLNGGRARIRNNRISGNSWDGIVLLRDAFALIENNILDGEVASMPKAGQQMAIELSWDAEAEIRGNYIANFKKGIGVFANSEANIRSNIIENIQEWGLRYWDKNYGTPILFAEENVFFNTQHSAVCLQLREDHLVNRGLFIHNAILKPLLSPRLIAHATCSDDALSMQALPLEFQTEPNYFFASGRRGAAHSRDLPLEEFRKEVQDIVRKCENFSACRNSIFYANFKQFSLDPSELPADSLR